MHSWPSWLAVGLGAVFVVAAFVVFNGLSVSVVSKNQLLVLPLFLMGAILLAAGLHALQASYDEWCGCADCMGEGGCGCNHCEECVDGDCCGNCECSHGGAEAHVHQPTA